MSKAEEFAYSKYPKEKKGVLYNLARNSIIEGYHQAEKDLELTWDNIKTIDELILYVSKKYSLDDEELYKEVLKRFKEQRT